MKTVGIDTPQVRRQNSTSQSLGTSMPTPWYVTVFHPAGTGKEVEVEVVGAEVGAVFELVVPEHAAKPTVQTLATPTNIHRTNSL